ncbi:hypothetical protein [Micromonospora sp. WMMD987]|uniref:hypothetical protein n=1 Tax=Micromonospora sp. WMMD987 TaxID=3016089 RepID=UPI00249B343E|nr:hypothetical protein [Micromonospora sp. WMMD987]WFE95788.1 hypothetical protein O7612_02315 [Micromonospora sp. WMMD987]
MILPTRIMHVLLAASTTVAVVANSAPAHAGTPTTPASNMSVALQSLMELYPDSTVVSEDTLLIAPGVEITMPASQPRNKRVLSKAAVKAALAAPNPQRPAPAGPPEARTHASTAQQGTAAEPSHYGCAYQYLCLWADQGFVGYSISFYTCGFRDLGTINYPTGGKWNDKVTGYVNNQTNGTVSTFSNWNGSSFVTLFSSEAIDWNSNIGIGGMSYNDIIDGVRVC